MQIDRCEILDPDGELTVTFHGENAMQNAVDYFHIGCSDFCTLRAIRDGFTREISGDGVFAGYAGKPSEHIVHINNLLRAVA